MVAEEIPLIPHSRPWLVPEETAALAGLLGDGRLATGEEASLFESDLAGRLGTAACTVVESGREALRLALAALGVGTGDEVIAPTYVCRSVHDAVRALGAEPVPCDVGPHWLMTPDTVGSLVGPRTRVVILVHLFGIAADTPAFTGLGVPVVENCCQAFGASVGRAPVGTVGDAGVFSFHATKCLTTGEGGMATSRDERVAGTIRRLRGEDPLRRPMTDLQAVLGRVQLARYGRMLQRRREIAEVYFRELPARLTARLAEVRDRSIFFRFPLTVDGDVPRLMAAFEERGVAVRRGVDRLVHRDLGLGDESFPGAASRFAETLSLPLYPALGDAEVERVVAAAREVLG